MLFAVWLMMAGLNPKSCATYVSNAKGALESQFRFKLTTDRAVELPLLLRSMRKLEGQARKKRLGWQAHHARKLLAARGPPKTFQELTEVAVMDLMREGLLRGAEVGPPHVLKDQHAWTLSNCPTVGDVSFAHEPREHMVVMIWPCKKRSQQGKVPVLINKPTGAAVDISAYDAIHRLLAARCAKATGGESDEALRAWMEGNAAPLFVKQGADGEWRGLTVDDIRGVVKSSAREIGLEESELGAHSPRIGGATDYFTAGVPALAIQLAGRWDSDFWQIYCRLCVGQTLDYAAAASLAEDISLEETCENYSQPASTFRTM